MVCERPVRVSVLDCPAVIEAGLKLHVEPLLHDKAMDCRKVLGPEAEMVKLAVLEPMRMTLDLWLEEREYSGFPVPVMLSNKFGFTAFDVIWTLPLITPVEAGVKLTAMAQDWPTFKVAGTVGKLVPQLLVSAKPLETVMSVIVTA